MFGVGGGKKLLKENQPKVRLNKLHPANPFLNDQKLPLGRS
jgi:hypothetical protein